MHRPLAAPPGLQSHSISTYHDYKRIELDDKQFYERYRNVRLSKLGCIHRRVDSADKTRYLFRRFRAWFCGFRRPPSTWCLSRRPIRHVTSSEGSDWMDSLGGKSDAYPGLFRGQTERRSILTMAGFCGFWLRCAFVAEC